MTMVCSLMRLQLGASKKSITISQRHAVCQITAKLIRTEKDIPWMSTRSIRGTFRRFLGQSSAPLVEWCCFIFFFCFCLLHIHLPSGCSSLNGLLMMTVVKFLFDRYDANRNVYGNQQSTEFGRWGAGQEQLFVR